MTWPTMNTDLLILVYVIVLGASPILIEVAITMAKKRKEKR